MLKSKDYAPYLEKAKIHTKFALQILHDNKPRLDNPGYAKRTMLSSFEIMTFPLVGAR
jgi:hypothetical protein